MPGGSRGAIRADRPPTQGSVTQGKAPRKPALLDVPPYTVTQVGMDHKGNCNISALEAVFDFYGMTGRIGEEFDLTADGTTLFNTAADPSVSNGLSYRDAGTGEDGVDAMRTFAEQNGMIARFRTNANIRNITDLIDNGIPPVVAGWVNGIEGSGHYMVVTGYEEGPVGDVTHIFVAGHQETISRMSLEEFNAFWRSNNIGPEGSFLFAMTPASAGPDQIEALNNSFSAAY